MLVVFGGRWSWGDLSWMILVLVILIGDSGIECGEDASMVFVQDMINSLIFAHEIYNFVLPIKISTTLFICLSSLIFLSMHQ